MAAAEVAREAIWLSMLLDHLGHARDGPVPLWSDNQGALATIKNPLLSTKSKHIRVRHHFVRERQLMKEIAYAFCPTEKMIADVFTKSLEKGKFIEFCRLMGMV